MPATPDPLELLVPVGTDVAGTLAGALPAGWTVEPGAESAVDRQFLDSFEGLLNDAGARLERSGGRAGTPYRLVLREPGRRDLSLEAPLPRAERVLPAEDLPAGPLRERLEELLELRAALPVVRVRSRTRPLAVRNEDAKAVVRLELEQPEVVRRGQTPQALDARLSVRPVLGYDKAFGRVLETLADLPPVSVGLIEEAAGRTLEWSSKVSVPMTAGDLSLGVVVALCRELSRVAEETLPGTIEDLDTEFLHDFRVAVRRTRSVLRECKTVIEPGEVARARDFLKWVQAATGDARDLDVQLLDWKELTATVDRAAELQPLHDLLVRRRTEALRRMRRDLRGARFREGWTAWRALLEPPVPGGPEAEQPIDQLAADRIRSVYRRMVRDGSAIDDGTHAEALHDLRKRGKELRYLLELFGGMWPADRVKPLVSALKKLQDVLGRFQDREVQADFLRSLGPELAAGPGGAEALMALGLVVDGLRRDQAAARDEFGAQFATFADKENRRLVKETFVSP